MVGENSGNKLGELRFQFRAIRKRADV